MPLARLLLPLLLMASTGATATAMPPAPPLPAEASPGLPPPPAWLDGIEVRYDRELRVDGLEERVFTAEHWWRVALPLLDRARGFTLEDAGQSAEGRPLRHVAWGRGETRVLLWSQMHGDESTATMALADLFRFLGEQADDPLVQRLDRALSLHIVPILNPDGAARFQRRNAQGIDINRDAHALASPEARALKALRDRLQPAFGFNLHDQRVGYRVGDSARGTAIALLAPPHDAEGGIDAVRARAFGVAALIRAALEPRIPGRIARWDDAFNPRAFGDLMARWGTSTILIESGGIEGDPQKQTLRRLNFLALLAGLDAIAGGRYADAPHAAYTGLPENGRVWPDLLVRGGTLVVPGMPRAKADVLVNFRHPLAERGGRIADIGDLAAVSARHVIDADGLFILPAGHGQAADIAVEAPARFHLSRDPAGRHLVWTLLEDVDPARQRPARAGTTGD